MADAPMIQLDPGGTAPILSYNVPDATSYHGTHLVELEFPPDTFKPAFSRKPGEGKTVPGRPQAVAARRTAADTIKTARAGRGLVPSSRHHRPVVAIDEASGRLKAVGGARLSRALASLHRDEIAAALAEGRHLRLQKTLHGEVNAVFVEEPAQPRPRLLLIERYRLSSFPGSYGAGKVLKTLTLLPGEKTKISVKTYLKSASEQKQASSILDSFTEESAEDFEESVQTEQSDKATQAENLEYNLEAEVEQSWGSGSAKVSGGIKGGTNATREEFAKNVTNAVNKHSMKASAKRDVQINTSFEVKEEAGEETSIEREITNLNVSRTLNFVFRQMNQEFLSVLHLVDVRIGFFTGYPESKRELPLSQIDRLLEDVVVDAARRQAVKAAVLDQLEHVVDYRGALRSLVETATFSDSSGTPVPGTSYTRVRPDLVTSHTDPTTGASVTVPGIIVAIDTNVLRTDGVIVEALLGQGESLDAYSRDLQAQTIRAKVLENDLAAARLRDVEQRQQIVTARDEAAAKVYAALHPPAPASTSSEG